MTEARAGVLLADRHAVAGKFGDAQRVGIGLGREAGQEVQLHSAPALLEGGVDGAVQVFLGDQLVDHLAQPPRAGLGGEREPAPASVADLARQPHREGIDAERGQVDGHGVGAAAAERLVGGSGVGEHTSHDGLDTGEVGGRERRERDLVVAGALEALSDHGAHLFGRPLSYRTGDHACLTEATTAGAAPEHLDRQTVVDDFGQRHERSPRVVPFGKVTDGALVHRRRHVGEPRA